MTAPLRKGGQRILKKPTQWIHLKPEDLQKYCVAPRVALLQSVSFTLVLCKNLGIILL